METRNRVYVNLMASQLIGSEILKIAGEVTRLKAAGRQVVNYTVGDFLPGEFGIPQELRERIIMAYQEGATNYPPASGLQSLRRAVADQYNDLLGTQYSAEEVLIGGGARPLIYTLFATIVDSGDTVVFGTPSWNTNHYCHLSTAVPKMVPCAAGNNFMPTASEIAPYLHDAVMLALCSPQNPTGTMISQQNLHDICQLVLEENRRREPRGAKPLYLMYDQIYWRLTFDGHKHHHPLEVCPELKDYVIYVDGASKCFAGTGIRVGWVLAAKPIIDKMSNVLGHMGAWAPKAEQQALASYLTNYEAQESFLEGIRHKLHHRLQHLHDGLAEMSKSGKPVYSLSPQGGIYLSIFFDLVGRRAPSGQLFKNTEEVGQYLLDEAGVALVPFSAFGDKVSNGWFRASVGGVTDDDVDYSLAQIALALDKLGKA